MGPFIITREEENEFGNLSGTSATLAVIAILLAGSVILAVIAITGFRAYHQFVRNGGFARDLSRPAALRQPRHSRTHQDGGTYLPNDQHRLTFGFDHYPNPSYPVPLQYISVAPVNAQPAPAHTPAAGNQDPLNNRGNREVYRAAFPGSQLSTTAIVSGVSPDASVRSITPPPPPLYSTDSEESEPETPTSPSVSLFQGITAPNGLVQVARANHLTYQRVRRVRRLRPSRNRRSSQASRSAHSVHSPVDF
jgi:hypothetical protein